MNTGLKREMSDERDNDPVFHKKMKYYTEHDFPDLSNQTDIHRSFGTFSQEVQQGTNLRSSIITNPRIRPQWGPLQTNIGSVTSSGPVVSKGQRTKKSDIILDNEYYKRSFYDLRENYNQVASYQMGGSDTRQDTREEYK